MSDAAILATFLAQVFDPVRFFLIAIIFYSFRNTQPVLFAIVILLWILLVAWIIPALIYGDVFTRRPAPTPSTYIGIFSNLTHLGICFLIAKIHSLRANKSEAKE